MQHFFEPIAEFIWDFKYRYKKNDQIIDQTIEETWKRVAEGIAKAEKKTTQKHWARQFYQSLEDFQFLPGGRILAGAGTQKKVTLFNCFVMNIKKDSLKAIFHALTEGALTLQQGGGVGYDFSVLRPMGALAQKRDVFASGPVSFMHIWDTMCSVLLSTGARRGAMMGVLRCDHPDIEEFIKEKEKPSALRHFNVSVMVTDQFMQAVHQDDDWALVFPPYHNNPTVYKYVKARQLWEKIINSAYQFAEPGVLFADTINRKNTLWYCENIAATNPCGEIPLPPYGVCDLGALNLTAFVKQPFTEKASIDWTRLEETVFLATRFLDNVIDISHYPLAVQQQAALNTRRIGLGLTGLGDTFAMMGLTYGQEPSLCFAKKIMQCIAEVTWDTSIDLAKEKGRFPLFKKAYLEGEFVQSLSAHVKTKLKKYGVRNSHHNTIAPAGTISLLANNVSNGIEPIFSYRYKRNVRLLSGEVQEVTVKDYAYHLWLRNKNDGLPPHFIESGSLNPDDHLAVQAALQPYIDNAISKTINLPIHFPFEALQDLYTKAYQLGLKGCTVFRPNPITGSILDLDEEKCCDRSNEDILEK